MGLVEHPQAMTLFDLDDTQLAKLAAWRKEHDPTCRLAAYSGAIGGRLTYTFTPTSLATIAKVHCACHPEAVIDVTDYDAF